MYYGIMDTPLATAYNTAMEMLSADIQIATHSRLYINVRCTPVRLFNQDKLETVSLPGELASGELASTVGPVTHSMATVHMQIFNL